MFSPSIVMPPSNTCGVTPLGQQQVSPVIPSTQEQLRPTPHFVAEKRPYRNIGGVLVMLAREATSHYHCSVQCIQSSCDPNFVPGSLRIPTDIYSQLNPVYREYLREAFRLGV